MPISSAAKLATHIWRGAAQSAASAAHNSANTFRNAFQGGAQGSSGGSTAGWAQGLSSSGSTAGAGTGGAKFHAGRGAQFSYQNSSRALSQANATSSNDASSSRNDEEEERRRKVAAEGRYRRTRRSSLSSMNPGDRPITLLPSNLTGNQMQARFRHAFSANRGQMLITSSAHECVDSTETSVSDREGSGPRLRRRNSTLSLSAEPAKEATVEASSSLPAASEVAEGGSSASESKSRPSAHDTIYKELSAATARKDLVKVKSKVAAYRSLPKSELSTAGFNAVMEALLAIRTFGQPIVEITDAYTEMVKVGLAPNSRTFSVLVRALCARDDEIQQLLEDTENRPVSRGKSAPSASTMKAFRNEKNFDHALQLAGVAHTSKQWFTDVGPYNALLRSCAHRGDVDKAIGILDLLERSDFSNSNSETFRLLVKTFARDPKKEDDETPAQHSARRLAACSQVFEEFQEASKGSDWDSKADVKVWNEMIKAHFSLGDTAGAVALFEQMLNVPEGSDAPKVTDYTMSAMILGFLQDSDPKTAVAWVEKIATANVNGQKTLPMPLPYALESLTVALLDKADDIDALISVCDLHVRQTVQMKVEFKATTLHAVVLSCIKAASTAPSAEADKYLDKAMYFVEQVFGSYMDRDEGIPPRIELKMSSMLRDLCNCLVSRGRIVDAASMLTYTPALLARGDGGENQPNDRTKAIVRANMSEAACAITGVSSETGHLFRPEDLKTSASLHLFAQAEYVNCALGSAAALHPKFRLHLPVLYRLARKELDGDFSKLPITMRGWNNILDGFCQEEEYERPVDLEALQSDGIIMMLKDFRKTHGYSVSLNTIRCRDLVDKRYSWDGLAVINEYLDEPVTKASDFLERTVAAPSTPESTAADSAGVTESTAATSPTTPEFVSPLFRQDLPLPSSLQSGAYTFAPVQVVDTDLGKAIAAKSSLASNNFASEAYAKVLEEAKIGTFPSPDGLAALLPALGRARDVERLHEVYSMSQHVLHSLVGDPKWQTGAWFAIEDAMIQGLSHAGQSEAASLHRHRMIAAGRPPSATAYASLIATIRDTTDDATIAEELFDESQRLGVRPHAYLFNTVISKLSRARKAERALQLFEEMTNNFRIRPTSVTFGAVINACTRIGDEENAARFFQMMERSRDFRPRVPPYNTMMQFFIQSVPDREKALVYYHKMRAAKVAPSAHTYKLLLDLHGSIEPVMPQMMEDVFGRLVKDPNVAVQGTHWASLINCYGCLLHDLDKAIEIFESIATHPSSQRNGQPARLPDAIAFEALLAVFVAHHRTDLIRAHVEKMKGSGIALTAYVANLLIRGYSMDGPEGLAEARQIFEAMSDPPAGVAAAGNHPPRAHGAGAPVPPVDDCEAQPAVSPATFSGDSAFASVNREPSTYEAMIRAELGQGNKARALDLVARMEMRAFPPALIIRARSLIQDDSPMTDGQIDGNMTSRTSFTRSPSLIHRNANPLSPPVVPSTTVAASASATSLGGVRHASTTTAGRTSGSTNPAPGPPKPNSPFTIFDRAAKTAQKDRAATRVALDVDGDGKLIVGDEGTRGESSRVTDYVRKAMAENLADRVRDIKRKFPTIVELGAGAGYLRHFLDHEGTGTERIIMCDTSKDALNRDRHLDSETPLKLERMVIDEEALPFEENSLDCVVVTGGLHWTNDLPGVLIQIRKALKPDGVFIAGLCGGDTLFELRTSLQLAEQEREGGISPRVSPMADTRDMASLLSRAGFTIPTVDVDEISVAYPSMYELIHDLRDMGESNAVINRRTHLKRDTLLSAGAIYQAMHGNDEEGVESVPATFACIYLIGWKPDPSQVKPLARGSASHSMKDALEGGGGVAPANGGEEAVANEKEQLSQLLGQLGHGDKGKK
ncbi:hypothetical protein IE53DRAFT_365591 [Violaceomyces palustris]|uniref:Uncharacterized protein n=1 Tax=Violaceomyces palustris TaxID=1673888 RepID=A0ACD0P888_9BASI|nr:hypothetical protein IE53DRAFT_365591 [Violaceomyces palustris]